MSEINWVPVFEKEIETLPELNIFAHELQQILPAKAVVALMGPMAAGKTELVKNFAGLYGINDVSSPTFALHQHYQSGKIQIEHLDLYRIESEDELESAGFWDLLEDSEDKIIFIEWPEKMRLEQIPKTWPLFRLNIQVQGAIRNLKLEKRT